MQTNSLVKSQKITVQQWKRDCEHQSACTVLYIFALAQHHTHKTVHR